MTTPEHEKQVAFKITHGYVRQDFVDGKCVGQKFVAGDQVDWENGVGDLIKVPDYVVEYQSFDMEHPDSALILDKIMHELQGLKSDVLEMEERHERLLSESPVDQVDNALKFVAAANEEDRNE